MATSGTGSKMEIVSLLRVTGQKSKETLQQEVKNKQAKKERDDQTVPSGLKAAECGEVCCCWHKQ